MFSGALTHMFLIVVQLGAFSVCQRQLTKVLDEHGFASKCPMRGRRCPELATGGLDKFFKEVVDREGAELMIQHFAGLTEAQKSSLLVDWESGKSRIALQMKLKTDAFATLPLKLAGIGHYNVREARKCAAICVAQFQQATSAQRASMHYVTNEILGQGCRLGFLETNMMFRLILALMCTAWR